MDALKAQTIEATLVQNPEVSSIQAQSMIGLYLEL